MAAGLASDLKAAAGKPPGADKAALQEVEKEQARRDLTDLPGTSDPLLLRVLPWRVFASIYLFDRTPCGILD